MSKALQQFIKKRKYLVWYVRDVTKLSEESIVEAVLNYGNWDDVQRIIKILGIKKVASIFREQTNPKRRRINYHSKTAHFFKLYFNKHA